VPAPGPIPSIIAPGNLQAEEVVSREVGYLGEFTNLGLGLNVRMFHEQVNGFIRQIAGPGYKTYANHEDFAIKGLEYQLKWQPWQGGQFILNQTHTDITSKDGLVNGIPTLETALAAPRLGSSLAYFQKLPGQLTLSLMHTKNQPASLIADLPYPLSRTDLRLAKALRWGSHQGEIALVVQNLGSAYPDYKREFLFERQAFVTLRLDD
jgi:iron complex outermembrane receptor protein